MPAAEVVLLRQESGNGMECGVGYNQAHCAKAVHMSGGGGGGKVWQVAAAGHPQHSAPLQGSRTVMETRRPAGPPQRQSSAKVRELELAA